MKNNKFIYKYNQRIDVLAISFVGKFLPGYGEMISDSTILRRSVKDNKLYGITIIGFRKGLNNGILNRDADNPLFPLSKEFYMKKLMEIANKEFK